MRRSAAFSYKPRMNRQLFVDFTGTIYKMLYNKNMATTTYHGTYDDPSLPWAPHLGLCLADDLSSATCYGDELVYEIELNLDGLRVSHIEIDWNHCYDNNDWPADSDAGLAEWAVRSDVIVYDDVDERGRAHKTYQLLTDVALAAITITQIED